MSYKLEYLLTAHINCFLFLVLTSNGCVDEDDEGSGSLLLLEFARRV